MANTYIDQGELTMEFINMENLQIVPVAQGVQPQYVEMRVPLYSYGCEKKVTKALLHLKGIYSVHVDNAMQKVTVWGICNRDTVLATIKRKRREARFWDQEEAEAANMEAVAPPTTEETTAKQAENAGELQQAPSQGFREKAAFYRRFKIRRYSWKRLLPLALVLSH